MDCLICRGPIASQSYGGDGVTCSGVCRKALGDARDRTAKYFSRHGTPQIARGGCVVCGGDVKVFWSSGKRAKYCSHSCRNKAKADCPASGFTKVCEQCGEEFNTRSGQRKFCRRECREEANRAKDRINRNGGTHERRCRKYKAEYRQIDPMRIFERDGWLCQICLSPVDRDVVFPDQLAATLDHIIPLSRGGDHIETNLQTAHWACNSAKSNKIEEVKCQVVGHQHQPQS